MERHYFKVVAAGYGPVSLWLLIWLLMDPAKQSSDVCVRQWEALDQAFSWQS